MKRNSIFSIFGALIIMSVIVVISGCTQTNNANTSSSSISAAELAGVWDVTQLQPSNNFLGYAYYEGSGETIYMARTPDNGHTFQRMHGIEVKFKNGKITIGPVGHMTEFVVKKEGAELKLYPILGGTTHSQANYTLRKDPAHASWGNGIKTAP